MAQDHSISWGALQFAGADVPTTAYRMEAMADGTNFGNPKRIVEIVKSLLTDGSLAVLEGWDNREAPIRLRLSAPDGIAGPTLAAAERALMAEISADRKAPLIWVPPATDAATCVFDVVEANLDRDTSEGWDLEEVQREYRYYLLTLTCLPFARPEQSVVVPALGVTVPPGSATVVDIDTCDVTTGWTHTATGALTGAAFGAGGGAVSVSATVATSGTAVLYSMSLLRTGVITMGATPYLRITVSTTRATVNSITIYDSLGASNDRPILAVAPSAVAGANDYYITGSVFIPNPASFRVSASGERGKANLGGSAIDLKVHHVARTDALPSSGTTRQLSRTATVVGSAPTQAAIRVFDATPAVLGAETLVYTSRNVEWRPALRPYRLSSSTVTADSARVSGSRNTLAADMVFRIPAHLFQPGTYALVAIMKVDVAGTLSWSGYTRDPSTGFGLGSSVEISGSIALATNASYSVLSLGEMSLPIVAVEDTRDIELTLSGTSNMNIDEVWLFDLTSGALTWLRDGWVEWIEIRSPELDSERPSVYGGRGAAGTGGVCLDFSCESFGAHRFDPGLMQVFTVTTGSLVSQSELEFYPRYHSHVEDESA